jgi:small conductance mechanosensitive channel
MWDQLLTSLTAAFGPDKLAQLAAQLAPRLLVAAGIMGAAHIIWLVARRAMSRAFERVSLPPEAQEVLQRSLRAALMAIAAISALGQLGVNTAPLLAALGLGGFTLSIAARDALSNVLSGLFLMWERPFIVGDEIEVDGRRGRVTLLALRATTLVSADGYERVIPNRTIHNATITRLSARA